MDQSPLLPELIFAIAIAANHAPTLGSFARTCRAIAAKVRAELMPQLVGARNYELLSTITTPKKRQRTTYLDLRYFWRDVRCAESLPLIAVMLRTRYIEEYDRTPECWQCGLGSIISHWIHIGLVNCARLLLPDDRRRYNKPYYGCHELEGNKYVGALVNKITMPTPNDSQYLLLCGAVTLLDRYYNPEHEDVSAVRATLDALDAAHFGLFVDMAANAYVSRACAETITASNEARPRYDPWMVNRFIAKWAAFHRKSGDKLQQIIIAADYVPGSRERMYILDGEATKNIVTRDKNWTDYVTRNGMLDNIVYAAVDKKIVSHDFNLMNARSELPYFHLTRGAELQPLDILRPCADCDARPPLVMHRHHKYSYLDWPRRMRDDYLDDAECQCKCTCGALQYQHAAATTNRFVALVEECQCCRCCRCKLKCVCRVKCVCGAPCRRSCTCCRCDPECTCPGFEASWYFSDDNSDGD